MSNNIIGLRELRQNTNTYIKRVNRGESFFVLRKNMPVFKISKPDLFEDEGSWTDLEVPKMKVDDLIKIIKNYRSNS